MQTLFLSSRFKLESWVYFSTDLSPSTTRIFSACRIDFLELQQIDPISSFSLLMLQKPLSLLVFSLDHCNSLISSLPMHLVKKLWKVSAQLRLFSIARTALVTLLLQSPQGHLFTIITGYLFTVTTGYLFTITTGHLFTIITGYLLTIITGYLFKSSLATCLEYYAIYPFCLLCFTNLQH